MFKAKRAASSSPLLSDDCEVEVDPSHLQEFNADIKGCFWEGQALVKCIKHMRTVYIELEALKVEIRVLRAELERKIDVPCGEVSPLEEPIK